MFEQSEEYDWKQDVLRSWEFAFQVIGERHKAGEDARKLRHFKPIWTDADTTRDT